MVLVSRKADSCVSLAYIGLIGPSPYLAGDLRASQILPRCATGGVTATPPLVLGLELDTTEYPNDSRPPNGPRERGFGLTRKGQAMPAEDSQLRTRASLLLRLRAGPDDQAAWQEFVARYGPLIYGWCRHWRMQPADAEDIAQSVLLKLAHLSAHLFL